MAKEEERTHVGMFSMAIMGHLIPLGELATRLCMDFNCKVTFIVSNLSFTQVASQYLERLCSICPHIDLHTLEIPLPRDPVKDAFDAFDAVKDAFDAFDAMAQESLPRVKQIISSSNSVRVFITTIFCSGYITEISSSAGIPSYVFFTTSGSFLVFMHWLPDLLSQISVPLAEIQFGIQIPGLPTIPAKELPSVVKNPAGAAFRMFRDCALCIPHAAGVLVNSFDALEDPAALLGKKVGSPIHNIGPVVRMEEAENRQVYCLEWLDRQPAASVVLLCLGSWATVSAAQSTEMEKALESCGHRFLWKFHKPAGQSNAKTELSQGRALGLGLVVETWVPQMEVLRHPATAGFVSHCGWNSTLESISCGVPIIPWPLVGDQSMNAVMMLQQYRVGVPLQRESDGFVKAESLKNAIVELMEGQHGRNARNRALQFKDEASKALATGGSSRKAMADVVSSWRN